MTNILPARPPAPPSSNSGDSDLAVFRGQLGQLPAFRALLRSVEAHFYVDLPLPAPVLDLGCGDGHFAAATFDDPLDVGLDPWWPPLREAGTRAAHRVLTCANGARMPFPDAHFATVVSNSVLEHIPEVEPVLHETVRVLAPGGRFYFCVPGPNFRRYLSVARGLDRLGLDGLAERYRRLFDRITRHYYYYDPQAWQARVAETGLRVTRWWSYFSPQALAALEWGHPLGAPTLVSKMLFGRWIVAPTRWNLALTERLLRRYYEESLPPGDEGAYLFFIARKP